MRERIYIEDFCEDLNYRGVILYIGNVNTGRLRKALTDCYVNHMYRCDAVVKCDNPSMKNYMYIENCDLQDLTRPVHEYIEDGYDVRVLYEDATGFYIKKNLFQEL